LKPHLRNLKGNSSHFEPTPVSIHKDQNRDQHFVDWTSPLFSYHIFSTSVSTVRDYHSIDRISSVVKLFYFQVSFPWYPSPFLRLAFQLSFTLSTVSPSLWASDTLRWLFQSKSIRQFLVAHLITSQRRFPLQNESNLAEVSFKFCLDS
jgi:hypothetical protein